MDKLTLSNNKHVTNEKACLTRGRWQFDRDIKKQIAENFILLPSFHLKILFCFISFINFCWASSSLNCKTGVFHKRKSCSKGEEKGSKQKMTVFTKICMMSFVISPKQNETLNISWRKFNWVWSKLDVSKLHFLLWKAVSFYCLWVENKHLIEILNEKNGISM